MSLDTVGTAVQPAPKGEGVDVTDLVIQDLKLRREGGIKKYGTSLRTHNGRRAKVDLYQELIDAVVYLRQELEEELDREKQTPPTRRCSRCKKVKLLNTENFHARKYKRRFGFYSDCRLCRNKATRARRRNHQVCSGGE